jgi:hypothetical protein
MGAPRRGACRWSSSCRHRWGRAARTVGRARRSAAIHPSMVATVRANRTRRSTQATDMEGSERQSPDRYQQYGAHARTHARTHAGGRSNIHTLSRNTHSHRDSRTHRQPQSSPCALSPVPLVRATRARTFNAMTAGLFSVTAPVPGAASRRHSGTHKQTNKQTNKQTKRRAVAASSPERILCADDRQWHGAVRCGACWPQHRVRRP